MFYLEKKPTMARSHVVELTAARTTATSSKIRLIYILNKMRGSITRQLVGGTHLNKLLVVYDLVETYEPTAIFFQI